MTITPQGQLYLCKTPLENDYKNQLTFSNASAQMTYFNSTVQRTFDNYTYIKKDNSVKLGVNIDEIIDCNYLFYKNTGFTNKYYFCFITNMEYVNENCTLITFETDCYQTWLFQIDYKMSFVEREHVNDDTVGLHTVPENLETGEYVIDKVNKLQAFTSFIPCLAVTELPSPPLTTADPPTLYEYGNNFSGLAYIIGENVDGVSNIIKTYDKMSKADAIQYLFMIPSILAQNVSWVTVAGWSWICKYGQIPDGSGYFSGSIGGFNKPTTLDGYTPKNKKLLTSPFCYINLDNNNGGVSNLRYEDFTGSTYGFSIDCVITPSCSTKISPLNYKKVTENNIYSIAGGKFPICSWSSDVYTNWLTQQAINNSLTIVNSATKLISGGIKSDVKEIGSGLSDITNLISEAYQKDLIPYQAKGNTNCGDVNFAKNLSDPIAYEYSIKQEYARIIDDYFSMYGYKVNRVKVPNITGRTNWNYVKTINCNFDGNIPQTDLNIIKAMFNNGVTLWHNPSTIYNYSNSNNIVT